MAEIRDGRWIATSSRTPEKHTAVLVAYRWGGIAIAWYSANGFGPDSTVTHWQPLPEMPEQPPLPVSRRDEGILDVVALAIAESESGRSVSVNHTCKLALERIKYELAKHEGDEGSEKGAEKAQGGGALISCPACEGAVRAAIRRHRQGAEYPLPHLVHCQGCGCNLRALFDLRLGQEGAG